jgi:catechol 2,3-dioxygenase-like lactoylglutathione lyase family enzyme
MLEQAEVAPTSPPILGQSRILSVFIYVNDLAESRAFYGDKLGLRPLATWDDSESATFDAGLTLVTLVPAADHGITLAPHNDSTDICFLVDSVAAMVPALERRGVEFQRHRTYGIGTVADFRDPNGHRLMLYQPTEHALTTPAGDKMRPMWAAKGVGGSELIGPPAVETHDPDELARRGLDGKPLVYLFYFIKEIRPSMDFAERLLGLEAIHRTPCCNDGCPDEGNAVIKYESGPPMLSTHHMHGHDAVFDDNGQPYGARDFEPEDAKGVAPLFHVTRLRPVVEQLEAEGADVRMVMDRRDFGMVARVDAPSGHVIYLYEPFQLAFKSDAGVLMREILSFGL